MRERSVEGTARRSPGLLGPTDLTIILGALDLLFLIFVIIQAGYLFGAADFLAALRQSVDSLRLSP